MLDVELMIVLLSIHVLNDKSINICIRLRGSISIVCVIGSHFPVTDLDFYDSATNRS